MHLLVSLVWSLLSFEVEQNSLSLVASRSLGLGRLKYSGARSRESLIMSSTPSGGVVDFCPGRFLLPVHILKLQQQ